ncbi:MAG TPA: ABC transporter permease [Acidimicrobiales bacterium]|jgi:peptide/nickel transport system permease protein|nr:ABC transporter permease [Acidimicrobiales bacterium]
MVFVAKRLLLAIVVLFVVTLLSFVLLHNLPGDPCIARLGASATTNGLAQCRHQLGLDQSLPAQYVQYLDHSLHGNLGVSYLNGQTVGKAIQQALPITVELLIVSQLIALIVAIPVGILAALRPDGVFDQLSTGVAFGLLAIPAFILGVLLVYLFAVTFHIFPATGYTPLTQDLGQNLKSIILPSLTLGLGSLAVYMRVLRTDMIATLREDFITMARAKGLPTSHILLRHAFRPSTFALVTVAGINIGTLIGGVFIVELIFQLPGIGLLTLNSIYARDYGIVQGTVLVVAVGFVLVNLLVDLLYAGLDPRTRHARATV